LKRQKEKIERRLGSDKSRGTVPAWGRKSGKKKRHHWLALPKGKPHPTHSQDCH